ncbi:hypothetical protein ACIBQ5_27700 [Streptomyces massasporeus]|uniref:hypothetical protein n=1 Tax=Streptomyces massasporeus TaxID=67324 RepID=UPI00378C1E9B
MSARSSVAARVHPRVDLQETHAPPYSLRPAHHLPPAPRHIQAESTDTSVTVSFLGTRTYDEITSVTGPRENVTKPERKVSDDKECVPQTPLEGFDVTVERVFYDDGREVKREPYRTHYTPRDEIVCE